LTFNLSNTTQLGGICQSGDDRVAKRLDIFLLSEPFLQGSLCSRSGWLQGGIYYHNPILLELAREGRKAPQPLQIQSSLARIPIIFRSHQGNLGPLQSTPPKSPAIQFMSNLKREKETSISGTKREKGRK
jgi:hypothetical protein